MIFKSLNAKTITGIEYFNPERQDEFKKNCLKDFKETQNKIISNSIIVDLQKTWEINYIGLLCNIYNGKTDQLYDQLIFFVESMKDNNISENNYKELYELFAVLITPFVEATYPELLNEINIDREKIDEQIDQELEFLELKVQIDDSSLPEYYTLITFYIFELVKKENFDKANELLSKFIRNTEKESYFRDYLYAYGPALIAISSKEKKYNLADELYFFLDDVQLYFSKYKNDDTIMLGNYFRGIGELTKILFENEQVDKIENLDKKYKFIAKHDQIPKNDLVLLDTFASLLNTYSRRLGGNSSDTYLKINFLEQLRISELAADIIINEIINSKEIFLDQENIGEIIDSNYGKLDHFMRLQRNYYTHIINNNLEFDREEYWRLFDKSFQISQLLSQNSLKQTIRNIIVKHKIKNPLLQELFDQKYKIEDQIIKINAKDENISNIKDYRKLKLELEKINNQIKTRNAEQLFSLTETISYMDIFPYLDDHEGLLYFQKTKFDNLIFYLINKNTARRTVIYKESELYENLNKLFDYSRNINNYNTNYFPSDESYFIYENLFLNMGVAENDIKNFFIIGDGNLSTFPYWLLLTNKNNSSNLSNISKMGWFSKKHKYNIYTSISDFYFSKKNNVTRLGINTDTENKIIKVFKSSLAEKNNLKVGDKIMSINGIEINTTKELLAVLNKINPNYKKSFTIKINRKGKIETLKIVQEKKNIFETLNNEINISFKKSKKYDFIGIGNPILSKKNNNKNNLIRGLFAEYETRGYVNTEQLQYFPELPETEEELKNIQSNFEIKNTKLYLKNDANEEAIKKANLSNAKFIVFASHALVSGEIDDLKEPGIVLTPTDNKNENEGLLLASEISNLNLINTDLVVLSACNTSSSSEANSIPLSGLAKSFFLAGAKSLIVSGWSVESNSAAYLSSGIFKKAMNEDINFSTALQNTINEMIDKNLHPLMWAPFILVGDI